MAKPASSLHSELGGRAPFGHRVPATSDLERGTTKGWFAPVREGDTLSLLLESIRLSPARLPSPRLLCGRQGSFRSITGSWLISKLPSSEEGPPSDERCGLDGAPSWSLRWHLAATGRIVVGGVRLRLSASVCVWVSSHCATSSLSHAERATKSSVDEVAMASFLFSRTFRRWRLGVGGFRSSEPTCALRGEPTCATRGSSSGAASSGACSCSLRQLSVVGVGAKRLVRSGLLPPRGGLLRTALPVTRSGLRYNSAAIRSAKSARRSRKRTKVCPRSISLLFPLPASLFPPCAQVFHSPVCSRDSASNGELARPKSCVSTVQDKPVASSPCRVDEQARSQHPAGAEVSGFSREMSFEYPATHIATLFPFVSPCVRAARRSEATISIIIKVRPRRIVTYRPLRHLWRTRPRRGCERQRPRACQMHAPQPKGAPWGTRPGGCCDREASPPRAAGLRRAGCLALAKPTRALEALAPRSKTE